MNIQRIEENLATARRSLGTVLIDLEQAHQGSQFNMFEPLTRRAETIVKKVEALQEIIADLKGVRCGK